MEDEKNIVTDEKTTPEVEVKDQFPPGVVTEKQAGEFMAKMVNDLQGMANKNPDYFNTAAGKLLIEKMQNTIELAPTVQEEARKNKERLIALEGSVKEHLRHGEPGNGTGKINQADIFIQDFRYNMLSKAYKDKPHMRNPEKLKGLRVTNENDLRQIYSTYKSPGEAAVIKTFDYDSMNHERAGVFSLPPDLEREIRDINIREASAIRRLATVRQLQGSEVVGFLKTGHARARWSFEKGPIEKDDSLKFDNTRANAFEMSIAFAATLQTFENLWFDLWAELKREAALAFGDLESDTFLNGTGGGQIRGLLQEVEDNNIGYVKSGVNGSIDSADPLIDMYYGYNSATYPGTSDYHHLKEKYARNSTWLMKRTSIPHIAKLKSSTSQEYIANATFIVSIEPATGRLMILGRPVEYDTYMPDFATDAFPILLGDFKTACTVYDRVLSTNMIEDPYTRKLEAIIELMMRTSVGFQASGVFEALTSLKASA
jgi:HK97 family phage major capsid protein